MNVRLRWAATALLAAALCLTWTLPASAASSPGTATPGSSTIRTVSYHGYQVDVPSSWKIYDLAASPTTCVRMDRHAVYLGAASDAQVCPTHLVGQTEALWIRPLTTQLPDSITQAAGASVTMPASTDQRSSFVIRAAGLQVDASYGADRAAVAQILSTAQLTGAAHSSPGAAASVAPAVTPRVSAPGSFQGSGFDTCAAPSAAAMRAWRAAPYRAVGIYIGGGNRACAQANLTASWVSAQTAAGWHLVPLYVGLQAPCSGIGSIINSGGATGQGQTAARDAVNKAGALGLQKGSVLYDDMENYTRGGTCSQAVLNYLNGWTTTLHALGYGSGVYSSTSSGIADLVGQVPGSYPEPDHIYFAHWGTAANTSDPTIPANYWTQHQRIHQYVGGHNDTYGGVTINVDSDALNVAPYRP